MTKKIFFVLLCFTFLLSGCLSSDKDNNQVTLLYNEIDFMRDCLLVLQNTSVYFGESDEEWITPDNIVITVPDHLVSESYNSNTFRRIYDAQTFTEKMDYFKSDNTPLAINEFYGGYTGGFIINNTASSSGGKYVFNFSESLQGNLSLNDFDEMLLNGTSQGSGSFTKNGYEKILFSLNSESVSNSTEDSTSVTMVLESEKSKMKMNLVFNKSFIVSGADYEVNITGNITIDDELKYYFYSDDLVYGVYTDMFVDYHQSRSEADLPITYYNINNVFYGSSLSSMTNSLF